MNKNKIVTIFFIFFTIISIILIYLKFFKKDTNLVMNETSVVEEKVYSSNIIENVNYKSKDSKGNEYHVKSIKGEIDYSDPDTIYLTNVEALIKLTKGNNIKITSDFGKYNTVIFDTIFSKNVIITYLDNKITGEYLDFSWDKNLMIISNNVILENDKSSLKTDIIELDIITKNVKIFMYDENKKINIKTLN